MEQGIVEDVNIFMDILEARTTVSASVSEYLDIVTNSFCHVPCLLCMCELC